MHKAGILSGVGGEESQEIEKNQENSHLYGKKAVRCEFFYAQSWNFIWSGRGRKPGDRKKSGKLTPFEEFRLKGMRK